MKRRDRYILLALVLAVASLLYPLWQRLTEPRYQGRPAHHWFKEFCRFRTNGFILGPNGRQVFRNGVELPNTGRDALRAMGEPAVVFFVKRIQSPALFNVPGYAFIYTNLPVSMRKMLPDSVEREEKRMEAILALASMGKIAEPAIPVVIDYALKRPGAAPGLTALAFHLPTSEMDRLLNGLAQQGRYNDIRGVINQKLVRSPTAAKFVAEILAQDKTGEIWPFQTLREIGTDAAVALPVLLRTIVTTNAEVRYQTVRTLEAIGPAAAEALPLLEACARNDNPMVQSASRRAIKAIRSKIGTVN